jgi:hypothetical protein
MKKIKLLCSLATLIMLSFVIVSCNSSSPTGSDSPANAIKGKTYKISGTPCSITFADSKSTQGVATMTDGSVTIQGDYFYTGYDDKDVAVHFADLPASFVNSWKGESDAFADGLYPPMNLNLASLKLYTSEAKEGSDINGLQLVEQ